MTIEGRVALRLDEFMLRLGHMTLLAQLSSSIEGRPRRLEKDFAELLTRGIEVEEAANQRVAQYLVAKHLCQDARKPQHDDIRGRKFRYPDLETYEAAGTAQGSRVRAIGGGRIEVWWQDYCLASEDVESSVGAVTVGARTGSSTGVSHILDWGVILGLLNRDFSATLEASLLARLRTKPADSMDSNPFVLLPGDRVVFAYVLLRADLDVFSRFAPLLLQADQPIGKADGAKLFGAAIELLGKDAENDANVSPRFQSVVFQQLKELKSAQRRKLNQPLGSSSTAWHRASSRLESYVDLGLLTKRRGGEILRFKNVYFPTDLLTRVSESVAGASSSVEWLEGPFIDFFGADGTRTERLNREQLRGLLVHIVNALGRPIQLFPLEALALGMALYGPAVGVKISLGGARSSLEELARHTPTQHGSRVALWQPGRSSFRWIWKICDMQENLFIRSPFALTASPEVAACWAGRHEVLDQLQRIQSAYERRSDSSLDMMWANLGAGKSHVLFHLAYRLESSPNKQGRILPIVVEMPEQVRSFHDLYRQIVAKLPMEELARRSRFCQLGGSVRELKQAGQVLAHGSGQEKEVALEWITGGRPYLTDLRRCTNIGRRIEDDVAATDAFCGILKALGNRQTRLVVLLDEFQRIGILKKSARDSLLSSLRSVFSRTPEFFSVLLGAALRMERNALDLLSPELRTLLGRRPTLSLPEMNGFEAVEFVRGRFQFFRPSGFGGAPFSPFSEDGVSAAIEVLKEKGRPLIPREILQALTYCYDECYGGEKEIGAVECKKLLEALQWDE